MTQNLAYTDEIARETSPVRNLLEKQYDEKYWQSIAPYIHEINRLKRERNAVVLAHNYMTPQIYHGIADVVGDSLHLAIKATEVQAVPAVVFGQLQPP